MRPTTHLSTSVSEQPALVGVSSPRRLDGRVPLHVAAARTPRLRTTSALKLACCGLFVLILALPTIQMRFGLVAVQAVAENRERVSPPADMLVSNLSDGGRTARAFEKFFDDNYGLRDFFIRLENQVQYSVFGESRQVIVGRDGWISDRSSIEVQQRTVDQLTDAQFAKLTERIAGLNAYLRDRGTTLILLPVPIKNTVYPEQFPNPTVIRPVPNGMDRLREFLHEHPEIGSVDVYDALSRGKSEREVYYRTDLHWTEFGASLVAEQTVNQIARIAGSPIRWDTPRVGVTMNLVGGERDSMALFWGPSDQAFQLSHQWDECGEYVLDTPAPYFGEYVSHCPYPRLPKTLLVGNSYLLVLPNTGFDHYFTQIDRLHDLTYFPRLLELVPSDAKFVVWEFFELEIGYQLQDDDWWAAVDKASQHLSTQTAG
jgi:alginate O-acetyltransferase complex protein AlgJ